MPQPQPQPQPPPQPLRTLAAACLWLSLAGLAAATLFAALGRVAWPFELFTHFPVQYAAGILVILIAAAVLRRWRLTVVAVLVLLPNLLAVSYYLPPRAAPGGAPDLRVITFNVLTGNRRHHEVREFLSASEADLILVMETDRTWLESLAPLETDYPHVLKAPRGDNFGMALYSRYPIASHQFRHVEGSGVPCLHAVITLPERTLDLVGGHPVPPVGTLRAASRNAYLDALAEIVADCEHPAIVLGDFNATVWSPFFRDFLKTTRLEDSGRKRGLEATWRRGHPLFAIPIDHILHTPDLSCLSRKIGPELGSDHRPVTVEFSF